MSEERKEGREEWGQVVKERIKGGRKEDGKKVWKERRSAKEGEKKED